MVDIPSSYGIDSTSWKRAIKLYSSAETDERVSISGSYADIKIPTFHLAGWYDFVGAATIDAFERIDRAARNGDGAMHKLLVGPWLHGQRYNGGTRIGEEKSPPSINVGIDTLAKMSVRWFDQWLRGNDTGLTTEQPIKLFVMGENKWRTFDRWPPKHASFEPWYVASEKGANGATGDGRLSNAEPTQPGRDRFVYDPMDPVATNGGANFHQFPDNVGIKDQRKIEKRDDVLVYTSEMLERDVTLIGPVKAVLYASTEGPNTDFTAKLVEVRSDGYVADIGDSIKRGPDPIDGKKVEKMEPGEVYRFTIDMDATAITIKKGHRLRVEISSSNSPKFTRNPNAGEVPEYATEFEQVTQTIHHSPEFRSHIVLPILKR